MQYPKSFPSYGLTVAHLDDSVVFLGQDLVSTDDQSYRTSCIPADVRIVKNIYKAIREALRRVMTPYL
jgi:hypothetical protein